MRTTLTLATLLASLALTSSASAQEVSVTPSGEYLMRFRHTEGLDFAPGQVDNFVTHRARVGMKLDYQQTISAFLQVQDVRRWGSESDTLKDFSAEGLDMHQAYFDLSFDEDFRLRVGRQEINYLNQRLIGAVGFTEQMRTFDAARLMIMALDRELAIDFFYARTGDNGVVPLAPTDIDDVFALAAKYQIDNYLQASFIEVVDLNSQNERVRSTTGLILSADYPFGLKASVEGYVQVGSQEPDIDIMAWMAAARLRFTLVDTQVAPYLELFGQFLSGDKNALDTDSSTFSTLFAANHKFYGEADLWQRMLATGQGLIDLGGSLGTNMDDILLTQLTLHVFSVMDQLEVPGIPEQSSSLYGSEVDLTIGVRLSEHFVFDINYSLIIPGEVLRPDDDRQLEHFFYFTAAASF